MRILVVHQNFPGQFGHLVRAWAARPGWEVLGLGQAHAPGLPGFEKLIRYQPERGINPNQHHYLRNLEKCVLNGQAATRAMLKIRQSGWIPDAVLANPGWGETLFAKEVFHNARLIHLCEWYTTAEGADFGFDPEFPVNFDDRVRLQAWNAHHALSLLTCDVAISPTHWQKSRYPVALQHKIRVQHEGINIRDLLPNPTVWIKTPSNVVLKAGDPVITYVARNLEPYRGFHIFMRALEKIQQKHPHCHALIVGGDGVSYGEKPKDALNWRERMLSEVALDPTRTHFLGRIPRNEYVKVLQVSATHVYLTYPFVLSWSFLEAMAVGAPIVASDTAPVREVFSPSDDLQWANCLNPSSVADAVLNLLSNPPSRSTLQQQASLVADRYSHQQGLAGYERMLNSAESTISDM